MASSALPIGRRDFLRALLRAGAIAALPVVPSVARAHATVGPVQPPITPPDIMLTRQDGTRIALPKLLQGKATAMQLMFTGCSETCPLQGALFAAVQNRIPNLAASNMQLLSLSIDALGDDARTLSAWLRQFGAGQRWTAAVPSVKDVGVLTHALQRPIDRLESHSAQVYFFDKRGILVWRTESLPPVEVVVKLLTEIAKA
jgi:protein SCO1/2